MEQTTILPFTSTSCDPPTSFLAAPRYLILRRTSKPWRPTSNLDMSDTNFQQALPDRSADIAIPPKSISLPTDNAAARMRSRLVLDSFSPVNQNGSFEFDRVIKSGYVQKRTQKTKVSVIAFPPCQWLSLTSRRRHGSPSTSCSGRIRYRFTSLIRKTS